MTVDRSPAAAANAHGRTVAAAGVFRARGQARGRCGRNAGRGVESRIAFGSGRAGRSLCRGAKRGHAARSRPLRRAGRSRSMTAAGRPIDFAGAAIAVADCADDAAAADFAAAARAAGVPVNVIDRPAFSDFTFGAIVNRSPLVIGISTDGASPVFAQTIRAKIEALIPRGFARWAEAARVWRPRIQALALSFRGRRGFWEKFTARAVAAPDRRAERCRSRCAADAVGHAGGRFGRCRRRRPWRSGIADAARRACAAIGRRDFVRRSGLARHSRIRAPRGEENADRRDRQRWLAPPRRQRRLDDCARRGRAPRRATDTAAIRGLPAQPAPMIAACRAAGIGIEVVPGIAAVAAASHPVRPPTRPESSPDKVNFALSIRERPPARQR